MRHEHEQQRLEAQHKEDLENFHKIYRKRQNKDQSQENFFRQIEESF